MTCVVRLISSLVLLFIGFYIKGMQSLPDRIVTVKEWPSGKQVNSSEIILRDNVGYVVDGKSILNMDSYLKDLGYRKLCEGAVLYTDNKPHHDILVARPGDLKLIDGGEFDDVKVLTKDGKEDENKFGHYRKELSKGKTDLYLLDNEVYFSNPIPMSDVYGLFVNENGKAEKPYKYFIKCKYIMDLVTSGYVDSVMSIYKKNSSCGSTDSGSVSNGGSSSGSGKKKKCCCCC